MVTLVWEPWILLMGELIVLDGKAYQAKGSGDQPEIVEVSPDALISLCSSSTASGRGHFPPAL